MTVNTRRSTRHKAQAPVQRSRDDSSTARERTAAALRLARGLAIASFGLACTETSRAPAAAPAAEPSKIEKRFAVLERFETLCANHDDGSLWGAPVCGPVLLVDPSDRGVVANVADPEGRLEPNGRHFVGELPSDQPVANAPLRWAGQRWAMMRTDFLEQRPEDESVFLLHESFHRIQVELGLYAFGPENAHLETARARYWLQLEWNALQRALDSRGQDRATFAGHALAFRQARRDEFPDTDAAENAVEIREGLAQYSALRLAQRSDLEALADVRNRRERTEGIARSFGYNSGPLYGYLLDDLAPGWRDGLERTSDLGGLLAEALGDSSEGHRAESLADDYGGQPLWRAERQREVERERQRAEFQRRLLDSPVLLIDLGPVRSATMDTRHVHPLSQTQIVFTVREMIAEWGKLTINGGALLEDRASGVGRLSLNGLNRDAMIGDGWQLEVAEGWEVVDAQGGHLELVREEP